MEKGMKTCKYVTYSRTQHSILLDQNTVSKVSGDFASWAILRYILVNVNQQEILKLAILN